MKKYILILAIIASTAAARAQNDLTFYHLGKVTPQSNHLNPAFFPDAKVTVSLPGLSGFYLSLNNGFAYQDVLRAVAGVEDSVRLDIDNLLVKLKKSNAVNFQTHVPILQVGVRLKHYGALNVFVNARSSVAMTYPVNLLEYAWKGNDYADRKLTEDGAGVDAIAFNELGIGYAHQFKVPGARKLRVGARFKMLQGYASVRSADDLALRIASDPATYHMNIAVDNPLIYTAGVDVEGDRDEYYASSSNRGFAVDFGAELELNEKINLAAAVNDIGSINWKEEVTNYTVNNKAIDFGGLDLKALGDNDALDMLKDTLESKFDQVENSAAYSTGLGTRTFIGGTYRVLPEGTVSATISNYFVLGKANTTFGAGYTHRVGRILTVSATIAKKPNYRPVFGGGFAARFGFFQLHAVVDDLFSYADARGWRAVDFRFGINFLFGRPAAALPLPAQQ